MGGEVAVQVGVAVSGIVFLASVIASQVSLHVKLTRLATCLDQIKKNDLPHLAARLEALTAECVAMGKTGVAINERISQLERWREKSEGNPATSKPERKERSDA